MLKIMVLHLVGACFLCILCERAESHTAQAYAGHPSEQSQSCDSAEAEFCQAGAAFNRGPLLLPQLWKTLGHPSTEKTELNIVSQMNKIYQAYIKPLEEAFKYTSLNDGPKSLLEFDEHSMVLVVGPWSTGKSAIINYLLQLPLSRELRTSAEPTTSEFTILTHGPGYRELDGIIVTTDTRYKFTGLEKFGKAFQEKLKGIEINSPLLRHLTLVDTPGIIENRRQQERGYPFKKVLQWFVERAALVLVVFDPSKLDVGSELEELILILKGHESKIRLILNKADSVSSQQLLRVFGALHWNLASLINVVEPPRIYVGSFWNASYKPETDHDLFRMEEQSLYKDFHQTRLNHIQQYIARIRQYAQAVLIHSIIVSDYLKTFNARRSIFKDSQSLWMDIYWHPTEYGIDIDSPRVAQRSTYQLFFEKYSYTDFSPLDSYCSFFSGCHSTNIKLAIEELLPKLLSDFKEYTTPDV